MPDDLPVKITRSSGSSWPYRFGPTPPDAPLTFSQSAIEPCLHYVVKQLVDPTHKNESANPSPNNAAS